ncbi:MAG: 3-hydroxybutyryl-CoA dehydrogenase, partial [Thermoleophilaceae bacterium]|nr:3-hydroxybutyryl-CoA dehydrogenase [Thermoleophilaceae bacterium]
MISRVGIVGGGIMGSGIAEVCARAGLDVTIVESTTATAGLALERVRRSLEKAVDRGKLEPEAATRATALVRSSADIAELADHQLVVEAVVE